jgi:hypothetical protein
VYSIERAKIGNYDHEHYDDDDDSHKLLTHIISHTHNAEGLCDRLGIFVDGALRCIGNPKVIHAQRTRELCVCCEHASCVGCGLGAAHVLTRSMDACALCAAMNRKVCPAIISLYRNFSCFLWLSTPRILAFSSESSYASGLRALHLNPLISHLTPLFIRSSRRASAASTS